MKFFSLQHSLCLSLLLTLPFLGSQRAQAFLVLPTPLTSSMTPIASSAAQAYPPELQKAIALLVQEKYAEADALLTPLIQAHPTYMPTRDFYLISQTLQNNWLTIATENAERAYRNLPDIGYADDRQGIQGTVSIPEEIQQHLDARDWNSTAGIATAIAQVKQQVDQMPTAIQPRLVLAALYSLAAHTLAEEDPAKVQQGYNQLREVVRRHPNDAQTQLILAENLPTSAEKTAAYLESIHLDPHLMLAWIGYADDALSRQQDLQSVIKIYQDAIQANPDAYQGYYQLGALLQQNQRNEEAIAPLRRATELQPSFSAAWSSLFYVLQQPSAVNSLDSLINAFERVSILNPEFSEFDVSTLNRLIVRANRIPEAVALYNRIGRKNPQIASQGFLQLGYLLSVVAPSRSAQVIRLYRRANRLMPNRDNQRALASALIRYQHPIEGEALLRQVLANEPAETAVYATGELAFAIAQQDLNQALNYLDNIYAVDPTVGGYEWIGSWLIEQKRWDEAKLFYERAVRQDPWYNIFLAQILAEQGQSEEAIAKLRTVLSNLPKGDPNYYGFPSAVLCDLLAKTGKLEEAIAIYQEGTRQTHNPDLYLAFGEFLKRQQRWEEAIAQYRLAIKAAESQHNDLLIAKSHRGIGEALIGTGRLAAAKIELEQARSLFQDEGYIDLAAETAREIQALP